MTSKDTRTAFHKVIRELFGGKLETETDSSTPEAGARITVKWAHQGQRNRGQGRGGRRNDAGKFSLHDQLFTLSLPLRRRTKQPRLSPSIHPLHHAKD
jgi:hypothetical protein